MSLGLELSVESHYCFSTYCLDEYICAGMFVSGITVIAMVTIHP